MKGKQNIINENTPTSELRGILEESGRIISRQYSSFIKAGDEEFTTGFLSTSLNMSLHIDIIVRTILIKKLYCEK